MLFRSKLNLTKVTLTIISLLQLIESVPINLAHPYSTGNRERKNPHNLAHQQFSQLVDLIRDNGIKVTIVKDFQNSKSPDSIYPNNWISFHQNNKCIIYPMFAENRRLQRNLPVLSELQKQGIKIQIAHDYTAYQKDGHILQGTGSMVLDRQNKICYSGLSKRTSQKLVKQFCLDMNYVPIIFQTQVPSMKIPVYHTNFILAIGYRVCIICGEAISEPNSRKKVFDSLYSTKETVIQIDFKQAQQCAGNVLFLRNGNKQFAVMSEMSWRSLRPQQCVQLEKHATILHSDIGIIEHCGGGSARCMLAEIFYEAK